MLAVLYLLAESKVQREMLDDAEETLLRLLNAYPSEIKTSEAAHNAFMGTYYYNSLFAHVKSLFKSFFVLDSYTKNRANLIRSRRF